jgi:hypothetical protein
MAAKKWFVHKRGSAESNGTGKNVLKTRFVYLVSTSLAKGKSGNPRFSRISHDKCAKDCTETEVPVRFRDTKGTSASGSFKHCFAKAVAALTDRIGQQALETEEERTETI